MFNFIVKAPSIRPWYKRSQVSRGIALLKRITTTHTHVLGVIIIAGTLHNVNCLEKS
jgi:hypothetical protein